MTPATRRAATSRIWILNHYADAPDHPAGTRHYDLARRLSTHGYRVTIFAAGFNHVTGREERLRARRLWQMQQFGEVKFVWLRTLPYRGNTLRRTLNMVSYLLAVLAVERRFARPDLVVGSSVHPLAALAGLVIAKRRRARFLFEIRDLWPQALIDMGAIASHSVKARGLRAVERLLVRRADGVVTLLPGMSMYLDEQGLAPRRTLYLPNGVALRRAEKMPADDPACELIRRIDGWRAAGAFVCLYAGHHGRANALGVLVEAGHILDKRGVGSIRLLLVGDGPDKPELQRLAASRGVKSVHFADPVAKHAIPTLLGSVDAAVFHLSASPVYRYGVSPNKLFDYMAAARPVVFGCDTRYDPVHEAAAGISVRPDDPVALADALLRMAAMSTVERAAMGANGRHYVEQHHAMDALGDRLAEFIESTVTG